MVAVGYSSISFLHEAAVDLSNISWPIYIYQLGDLDPAGRKPLRPSKKTSAGSRPKRTSTSSVSRSRPSRSLNSGYRRHCARAKKPTRGIAGLLSDTAMSMFCKAAIFPVSLTRSDSDRSPQPRTQDDRAASAAQTAGHDQFPGRTGRAEDRAHARPVPHGAARARADHRLPQWWSRKRLLDQRVSRPRATTRNASSDVVGFGSDHAEALYQASAL